MRIPPRAILDSAVLLVAAGGVFLLTGPCSAPSGPEPRDSDAHPAAVRPKAAVPAGGGGSAAFRRRGAAEPEPSGEPDDADGAVAFLRRAFADWRDAEPDEESEEALLLAVRGLPEDEALSAAAALMERGTKEERMDALWVVANRFGFVAGGEADAPDAPPGESAGGTDVEADEASEQERFDAATRDIAAIVSAGLDSPDEDIRDIAFETAAALPPERSAEIYARLLGSDSKATADLRKQLMERLEGAEDPDSAALFVRAMDGPDMETAAVARRRLEAISGRVFGSAAEAAEWLEREWRPRFDPGSWDAVPAQQ